MISHGFLVADTSSRGARAIGYAAGYTGGLGVALFFAISGYLITTLLLEERERSGRISLRAFYVRRAFRILPAAYLYLFSLLVLGMPVEPGELPSAAFFFGNYWPARSWYTQHFWSLSMEEHFYLFWPAMLALLGVRRAAVSAGLLIAATALWRPWSLTHVHLPVVAPQRTDMRLDAFLFAGALAILLHSGHRERAAELLAARWFRIAGVLVMTANSALSILGSSPAIPTLIQSALLPALLVSLILACGSWLYRVLEGATLRWIGRISNGLYLWQQFFLVGHTMPTISRAAVEFLPKIAATLAVASASYYILERPALSCGRRISARLSKVGMPAFRKLPTSCAEAPS